MHGARPFGGSSQSGGRSGGRRRYVAPPGGARFGVSVASAMRWMARSATTGGIGAEGAGRRPPVGADRGRSATSCCAELRGDAGHHAGGAARGWPSGGSEASGIGTIWRFFDRRGITLKKRRRMPASRTRPDVKRARGLVRAASSSSIRSARLHRRDRGDHQDGPPARAPPRGERCRAAVPHGHWKTTTFVAGLRLGGIDRADGPRRPDERRRLPRLCRAGARPRARARRHRHHGQSAGHKVPAASARRSRRPARGSSTCRPTRPTSIRSRRPSPSSRPCFRAAAERTVDGLWAAIGNAHRRLHPRRMRKLLRRRRIRCILIGKCSSALASDGALRRNSPVEPAPSLHIVGHVGQRDRGLARAMPMVRMNRPIGPFCSAKTCSTRARIFDSGRIGPGDGVWHRFAPRLLVMDAADLAEPCRESAHWPPTDKRCRPRRPRRYWRGRSAPRAAVPLRGLPHRWSCRGG